MTSIPCRAALNVRPGQARWVAHGQKRATKLIGRLRRQPTHGRLLGQPTQGQRPLLLRSTKLATDLGNMAGEGGEWKNGLCGCFGDCGVCILTYFLPCVTAGYNAEKVGKNCCLYGFLSLLGCIGIYTRAVVRTQIREVKGIQVTQTRRANRSTIIRSL